MANTYDIGDVVRLSAAYAQADVALDPTTVALTVVTPSGVSTDYSTGQIAQDSTGRYHYDLSLSQAGRWSYRWVSTGTGQATEEGWFLVRSPAYVPPPPDIAVPFTGTKGALLVYDPDSQNDVAAVPAVASGSVLVSAGPLQQPVYSSAPSIAGPLTIGGSPALTQADSLDASKLTGTLPALSGANLTVLPASNLTGTVPDVALSDTAALHPVYRTFLSPSGDLAITRRGTAYTLLYGWGSSRYWEVWLQQGASLRALDVASESAPMNSSAAFTTSGTWTTVFNSATYNGQYKHSSTAGDTASFTTPASVTRIGYRGFKASNGGLLKVSIDGSLTAANLLPTAQVLVDRGEYANTILVANGGTLNPTDRVLDTYTPGTVTDARVGLADGLTAGAHAVVLTATGYTHVGGGGARGYVAGVSYATASTDLSTASVDLINLKTLNGVVNSAWEYAVELRPDVNASPVTGNMTSGSAVLSGLSADLTTAAVGLSIIVKGAGVGGADLTATVLSRNSATQVTLNTTASTTVMAAKVSLRHFVGNIAHGFDTEDSFTITVDGATVTPADGSITIATDNITITRQSHLTHLTASGTIGTATTVYRLDRYGLRVSLALAWNLTAVVTSAYTMMPMNGPTPASMDGVSLTNAHVAQYGNGPIPLTAANAFFGSSKSAAAWVYGDVYGGIQWMPNVTQWTGNWANSGTLWMTIQDRSATTSKIYCSRVGTPGTETVTPGTTWTATTRYLARRFPSAASGFIG